MDTPQRHARAPLSQRDGLRRAQGSRRAAELPRIRALLERSSAPCLYSALAQLERATRADGVGLAALVRFHHDAQLEFSARDFGIHDAADASTGERVLELSSRILGLGGPVSPVPMYLIAELATEDPDRPLKRRFLDIFHNHLLHLLYRLVARTDFASQYRSDARDRWSRRVLALTGHDAHARADGGWARDRLLLRLAPVLARRGRTSRGLEVVLNTVLSSALGSARVTVQEFIRSTLTIDPAQRTRLGERNSTLGDDLVLGSEVEDRGDKFRVRVGALGPTGFRRFLPGGIALGELARATAGYVSTHLAYDIELVLAPGSTPRFQLSCERASATRLGLDAWLAGAQTRQTSVLVEPPEDPR